MCVDDALADSEHLDQNKVGCPSSSPTMTVNESSPPMWLEIGGTATPDQLASDDKSWYPSLPSKNSAIEPPLDNRSEQEMSAAAALLELAETTKWLDFVVGINASSSPKIRVEVPFSQLRRMLLENVNLTKAIPETGIVSNLVHRTSEQRPIKTSRPGEAALWSVADLELVPSSPKLLDRKGGRGNNRKNSKVGNVGHGKLRSRTLRDQKFLTSADNPRPQPLKDALLASRQRDSFQLEQNIRSKKGIKPRRIDSKTSVTSVEESVLKTPPVRGPKMFSCAICQRRYSNSSNLSRHRQVHRNLNSIEAMTCEVCKKTYVSRPAFVMHVRTHCKMYNCTFCPKSFSRKWSLEGHIRTHTGEKPYACYLCRRLFSDRSNMHAHTAIHQQGKTFPCPLCGKVFRIMHYYTRHLKKVHKITKAELTNGNRIPDDRVI